MGRLSGPKGPLVLSCKEALSWVIEKSYRNVVVQSDSLLMVSSPTNSVSYLSYGATFKGLHEHQRHIPQCSILFTLRSANQAVTLNPYEIIGIKIVFFFLFFLIS